MANTQQSAASKITEAARKNHEEMFPHHQSKVKDKDPEFIEVFDNFAFDEVIAHDAMDVRTRVILILASTIGSQALTEFKMMAGAALNVGVTPVEIKEQNRKQSRANSACRSSSCFSSLRLFLIYPSAPRQVFLR